MIRNVTEIEKSLRKISEIYSQFEEAFKELRKFLKLELFEENLREMPTLCPINTGTYGLFDT